MIYIYIPYYIILYYIYISYYIILYISYYIILYILYIYHIILYIYNRIFHVYNPRQTRRVNENFKCLFCQGFVQALPRFGAHTSAQRCLAAESARNDGSPSHDGNPRTKSLRMP